MKYLKFYENFIEDEVEIDYDKKELSDKTIDDVLSDNFFDRKDLGSYIDSNGVVHIKNWLVY
jgi:hypothetical protein